MPNHFPPLSEEPSVAEIDLGRWLFYDVRLSKDGTRSCGICHEQHKAFSDGLTRGIGIDGALLSLNSLSLVNVAWRQELTWFQKIGSIETHMEIPLLQTDPIEMGMTEALVVERLADAIIYQDMFATTFLNEEISFENTIQAITAFTQTISSGNSPYDLWLKGEGELTESQDRGRQLFFGNKTKCSMCHGGIFFDQPDASLVAEERHGYFNIGLYNIDGEGGYPLSARGLIEETGNPEDMGKFRVPTLRNLAYTKPWMHDGTEINLENIIQIYARGGRKLDGGAYVGDGRDSPLKSPLLSGFELSPQEQEDLMAFLDALNDSSLLDEPRLATPFCMRRSGEIINIPCEEPYQP